MTTKSEPDKYESEVDLIYAVTKKFHDHMACYGYQHVDTPIVNRADLFLTKAGDRIAEQLFTFEHLGHVWALRPEFTAAAAYMVMKKTEQAEAVRWQFSGPIFRNVHESGDREQQFSAGAEAIGLPGSLIEAEIIAMAAHGLSRLKLTDWKLVIGHVGLTRYLIERFHLDSRLQRYVLLNREILREPDGKQRLMASLRAHFPTAADEQPIPEASARNLLGAILATSHQAKTMGGRTQQDIAQRLSQKQHLTEDKQVEDAVGFLAEWTHICEPQETAWTAIYPYIGEDPGALQLLGEMQQVLELLEVYDVPPEQILIQPDLARSWDYYTGTVFEIRSDDGKLLAGGGRYDELTRLLGAETGTPAFGFAYELETVAHLQVADEQKKLHYLVVQPEEPDAAIQWAQVLRAQQVNVVLVEDANRGEMHVEKSGNLIFEDQVYTRDEVSQLVARLKGY